jgi:hypothetical protein
MFASYPGVYDMNTGSTVGSDIGGNVGVDVGVGVGPYCVGAGGNGMIVPDISAGVVGVAIAGACVGEPIGQLTCPAK